jgi:hypothetical protein
MNQRTSVPASVVGAYINDSYLRDYSATLAKARIDEKLCFLMLKLLVDWKKIPNFAH